MRKFLAFTDRILLFVRFCVWIILFRCRFSFSFLDSHNSCSRFLKSKNNISIFVLVFITKTALNWNDAVSDNQHEDDLTSLLSARPQVTFSAKQHHCLVV